MTTTFDNITSLKLPEDTEYKHFLINTVHITIFSSDYTDCSPVRFYMDGDFLYLNYGQFFNIFVKTIDNFFKHN